MSKQLSSYIGLVLLFLASFLALNWVYGYVAAFQYDTNDCFFIFGRPFLAKFFDYPAGGLFYAGRFLGQFYHYRWLGTLIVIASIACFGVLFYRVLAKLNGTVPLSRVLFPCILLLVLHTSVIHLLRDTLGPCASCGAFWGYLYFRGKVSRRVYAFVATPVLYVLVGAYVWIFVAWIVAFEWLEGSPRSKFPFRIGYVVFSIAMPLVAWRWVYLIALPAAFLRPLPLFRSDELPCTSAHFAMDCALVLAFLASLLLIPFWDRLFSGTRLAAFWQTNPEKRSRIALAAAIPVLAILIHLVRYDASMATFVARRQLYKHKQWDALLEEAKNAPSKHLCVQFMTNYALSHKRKLLDEMFHHPQMWGTRGLVLDYEDTGMGLYNSDLFYEAGHINVAFRHAYNYLHLRRETYDGMKRLAQCSMVNGNYAMAEKYLSWLEKTLFHRAYARRYKAIIKDPAAAEREFHDQRERLIVKNGAMFVAEGATFDYPIGPLLALLEARSDNRMAFDYLTAWLLLNKKNSLATICANMDRFKTSGYTSIPVHCQEAALLWERLADTRVDLHGLSYDDAIKARVDRFLQDLSLQMGRPDAAEQLQAVYGDTYMFYYCCVTTPADVAQAGPARGTVRQE